MAQADARVDCALEADNYLGETPVWSVAEQALYWVNCENPPELHRWRPNESKDGGGAHDVWPMPDRVGGFVLKDGGGLLVVLADGLYDFDPSNAKLAKRVASPLPAHVKLHECQCDRQGRLWVGAYDHHFTPTNRDPRGGSFFRLDGETLTPVIGGINVANGLAVSPDGKTLYASDSPTRTVEAFDLDPATGALSNRRVFFTLKDGEGFVDGATVDAEGCYWLAAVGVGQLRRYRPDGALDRVVQLPCSNPTKPVFGGPDLDVIYVTSTKLAINMPGIKGAERNGGLFAVRAGVRGLADPALR
jgi:sugar lactone lactonase YvrE